MQYRRRYSRATVMRLKAERAGRLLWCVERTDVLSRTYSTLKGAERLVCEPGYVPLSTHSDLSAPPDPTGTAVLHGDQAWGGDPAATRLCGPHAARPAPGGRYARACGCAAGSCERDALASTTCADAPSPPRSGGDAKPHEITPHSLTQPECSHCWRAVISCDEKHGLSVADATCPSLAGA
eukprot:6081010-Prymnesium_polylepis.1